MWPGVNSGLLGPHNVLICYICCANQQSARARENQSLQTQRWDKEFRVKSGFLSFARQVTGLQHISLNPMWTSAVLPYRVSKFWVENPYHGSMGIDLLGVFLPSLGPHRMKLLSVHSTFLWLPYIDSGAVRLDWVTEVSETLYVPVYLEPDRPPTFFLGARASETGTWYYVLSRSQFALVDREPLRLAGWYFDGQGISSEIAFSFNVC